MANSNAIRTVFSSPIPASDINGRALALTNEMLDAYQVRRTGALRHSQKTVARDLFVIKDFMTFSGQPPWFWTEDLFDGWCNHLWADRKLAPASQRHYQSAIRGFLEYLTTNIKFTNEVRRRFGVELTQICTADNCIPHVQEREMRENRRALTHEEIIQLFSSADDAIRESHTFRGKDFEPLRRDKALLFTLYALGLRASEALNLDVESFQPNPAFPKFGRYGLASVKGKGAQGSGGKFRIVPVDHPGLPPVLKWYVEKVRPSLLRKGHANEDALFLSERGKRMSISTLEARFQNAITRAGLGGKNLTPHSLRHSSVTHGLMDNRSLESMRLKHGHVFASTTQGYAHIPDEFVNRQVNAYVDRQLKSI